MRNRFKLRHNFFGWSFAVLLSAVVLQLLTTLLKIPPVCRHEHLSAIAPSLMFSTSLILFVGTIILWFGSKKSNKSIFDCMSYAHNIAEGNYATGNWQVKNDEFEKLFIILQKIANQLKESRDHGSAMGDQIRIMTDQINAQQKKFNDELYKAFTPINELFLGTKTINDQSNNAVSCSEELHSNMISVSSAAEQSKNNIDLIAAVIGEMNCNIEEITVNSKKANSIMQEAVSGVKNAFERIDTLSKASEEITSVIEIIVEIAEQTKLLALNATIEAARAGEAGKGFAVVASEVKDLAAQTNDATRDIKNKIEAMRCSTESTIDEIRKISDVTQSMTNVVTTIAAAVEEQSLSRKNISKTISDAESQTMNMVNIINILNNNSKHMNDKTIAIHSYITDCFAIINKIHQKYNVQR